jgi:formylglycine-generating enzyme required for sulfatase activity
VGRAFDRPVRLFAASLLLSCAAPAPATPRAPVGLGPLPAPGAGARDGDRTAEDADAGPDDEADEASDASTVELAAEDLSGPRRRDPGTVVVEELPPCPASAARAEMTRVPAGPAVIGCDEPDAARCREEERPRRVVDLPAFEIDRTEVTQAAYARCVAAGACTRPAGVFDPRAFCRHPAVAVSWPQADAFCRWAGKRLPTELEWEKAARGAGGARYPWGDEAPTCGRAAYRDCGSEVGPVGALPDGASPYGVLDLAGNVREWLADAGPKGHRTRAIRGGAAIDPALNLAAWRRAFGDISITDGALGFRCAR